MNNGDKVRQMTNKELIEWGIRFFRTDWDDASVVMSDKEIKESCLDILNSPHETTADEDFAEIGFDNKHEFKTAIQYTDNEGNLFFMAKCGTNSYSNVEGENADWTDDLIDQIRPIADKKRKEVWG